MTTEITPSNDRELVLTRLVDVPAEKLYRCWTEPDLLTQWFAPAPWTTPSAQLDVRAGGASLGTMRSPEGDTTRYTARARHGTKEATEQHVAMGFHEGWGVCTDQLVALAKTL